MLITASWDESPPPGNWRKGVPCVLRLQPSGMESPPLNCEVGRESGLGSNTRLLLPLLNVCRSSLRDASSFVLCLQDHFQRLSIVVFKYFYPISLGSKAGYWNFSGCQSVTGEK